MSILNTDLVSVSWLQEHISEPTLKIIDASWFMPGSERSGVKEWEGERIDRAVFFDFDQVIKDQESELPHMLPSADYFSEQVGLLGVQNDSDIVVYDSVGMFASPRVWWMFKAMGHNNVAVLDGGLPAWLSAGGKTHKDAPSPVEKTDYKAELQSDWVISAKELEQKLESENCTVLDARPNNRFLAQVLEPRKGVRSGHMPGAKNLPFLELLVDGKLKSKQELSDLFDALAPVQDHYYFTCGSGVTACILALAASLTGRYKLSVYDGSWTEWGSDERYPVVK
ncbi:sulfurtransferase [Vibrio sp. Of7-15]|uniref:sulfurtransferase n=1 Tax=Vibrio sp. Of7-15 TaxID=2724879 RepID=UPI001EF32ABE|nr:sulfurtransferase [Vibrio sp. Of7-15]